MSPCRDVLGPLFWLSISMTLCQVASEATVLDSRFDPCKPLNPVNPSMRAGMAKTAAKVISTCAYKIVSDIKVTWGKELVKAIPKFLRLACFYMTVAYNFFAIKPNSISEATRHNSTELHNVLLSFEKAIEVESRANKNFCFNIEGKKACFARTEVVSLFKVWMHCYWVVVRGIIPATTEEFLGLYILAVKRFISTGLIKFYIG